MPHLPPRARKLPEPSSIAQTDGPPPDIVTGASDMPVPPDREPPRPPIETKPTRRKYGGPRIGIEKINMRTFSPDLGQTEAILMAAASDKSGNIWKGRQE